MTVEIIVTMSKDRMIAEIVVKLATDPIMIHAPFEAYSLAFMAFGLLGMKACFSLVSSDRISLAFL